MIFSTQPSALHQQQALDLLANETSFDKSQMVKIAGNFDQLAGMLHQAVLTLGLELDALQYWQLLKYLDTLLVWNKAYNLTAITEPNEALIKHIFDCLAILPAFKEHNLPAEDLFDIGTGAGLPAIIVAICEPNRQITPLDSNQKRIRFIRQVVSELGLKNVRPVSSRIENYTEKHELITSRAFASLQDFVELAAPCLSKNGTLIAMKGKEPTIEEVDSLSTEWEIEILPLQVPYLADSRHLVILEQKSK